MKLTGNGSRNRNVKITDPDTCENRRCHGSGFFLFPDKNVEVIFDS